MSQSVPPTTPAKRLIAVTVQLSEEHTAMLQKLNQLELNLLREEARADILTHLACGGVEHIVAEDGIRVEPSPKLNALDTDIRIATHASREQYYAVRARLSENIPIARTDSLLERLTAKISQPNEGTSTLPQDSQNTWGTILVNVRLSQEHSTQLRNLTDSTVRAALQEEARHDIHECLSRAGLGDAIPIHMIHVTPSMDIGALDVDVHIPKSVRPHEYTSIQTCLSKDIPIPRSARILRGASCSSRSIASDATQSVPGRMPVSEQPVRRDRSREPHSRTASHAPTAATAATPRSNAATRTGRTSCYVIPVTMKLSTIHSRGLRSINLAQLQELQGFAAQDIYSHLVQFSLGSYIKHEHITVHPATHLNALNVDVKLIAGNGESVHRRLRAALSETIAIPRAGALLERAARSRNATTPKRSNSSNKASRIHTSTQRARSSHSSLRRGSFGGLSEAKSSTSDVFASNVATPRGGPRGRSLASSPTNRCARCVHYTHRGAAPEEPFMKSPRNGGPSNPVSPRGHHNKSQSVTTVPSPRLMKSQNQPPSQHNPPVSLHYNPKELHQSTPVRSPNDGSIAGNGTMNNNSFTHSTPNANRVPSTPSGQAPPNTAERVPVSATLPSSHLVSETMPREQQHHDPGFDPHSSTETRGRPQNSSAEVPINASTPLQDKTNPTNSVGGTPSNAPASTLPVATPYHAFKDHAPSTSVTSSYNHGPSSSVNSGAALHSTAKTSDDYDPALDSNIRTNPSSSLSSSIHGSQKNTGSVQPSASTVPSALSQSQKDLLYSVPADYVRNPNDSMSSTVHSTVNSVTMLPSSFGDSSSSEVKVNASVSSTQPTSRAIPYHQNGMQSSPSSSLISSQLPVTNSISNSQPSSVTHTMDSVHNTVRSAPSNTASSLSNPTALASKSTTSPSSSFLTSSELLRAHNSTPAQSQPVVGSSISTNTLHEKPEAHSINSEPPVLVASNPDMIPGVVIISPDTRALLDKSSNILSSNYDELKRAIRCDVLVHVSGLPINLQASDVSVVDVTSPFTIQVEVPLRAAATKGSKEQLRLRMNEKISATEFSNVVRRLVS